MEKSHLPNGLPMKLAYTTFALMFLQAASVNAINLSPELQANAVRAATTAIDAAIVQLQYIGGADPLATSDSSGPTTGLLIDADGTILTSNFGLDPPPASILVRYAEGTRTSGKLLAIDHNRGLALIQVSPPNSEPPKLQPADAVRPGETAIALGRTYNLQRPNIAVGIVSATGRMFGRAVQTDAAVSPANYGGPLINLRGQVIGVLTPLAPESQGDMTGVSWYDSGIGFAVPLSDALDRLPMLRSGTDIRRGLAGIALAKKNPYRTPARLLTVHPGGPAQRAGLKAGDVIVRVNDQPVDSAMAYRLATGVLDAGQQLNVVAQRDGKSISASLTLTGELEAYRHTQLGVILKRPSSNPEAAEGSSLKIMSVIPTSPAAEAGIKAGDNLISITGQPVASREETLEQLAATSAGDAVSVLTSRGEKRTSHQLTLTTLEHTPLPQKLLPELSSDAPTEETIPLPGSKREVRLTIPAGSDVRPLVVWIGGSLGAEPIAKQLPGCAVAELLAEKSQPQAPLDRATIVELLDLVASRKQIDTGRIAIGGAGKQTRIAAAAALSFRGRVAGAALLAPAAKPPRIRQNTPTDRLAIFIQGATRRAKSYTAAFDEAGYSTFQTTADGTAQLLAWLEGLDRI